MFSEIMVMILRWVEVRLEKLEDKDHTPSFDDQWEMHISREFSCGPKSEIPRGDYLHGNKVVTQDTYRTWDGMACFEFLFHQQKIIYEVEAVFIPLNDSPSLSGMEGKLIPSGNNPPVKTYFQAKKLAKVWAEYVWNHIKKECHIYSDNQFQKTEQEEVGEDSGKYYNPDMYGRKVVRMR